MKKRFTFAFGIQGRDIDPVEITKSIGLSPSLAFDKNEPRPSRGKDIGKYGTIGFGKWEYEWESLFTEPGDGCCAELVLQQRLEEFLPRLEALDKSTIDRFYVRFNISSNGAQYNMDFPSELIILLAKLPAHLYVSCYDLLD